MKRKRWAVPAVIVLVITATLFLWQITTNSPVSRSDPGLQQKTHAAGKAADIEKAIPQTAPAENRRSIDKETAMAQLVEAAKAVPDAKPIDGAVAQRPDFVSEFEWELLQNISSKHPEKDKELTQLVNKLLFFKKCDMWESLLAADEDMPKRHALAREILAMLPGQVHVLGPEQADKMRHDLMADLNGRS